MGYPERLLFAVSGGSPIIIRTSLGKKGAQKVLIYRLTLLEGGTISVTLVMFQYVHLNICAIYK